VEQVLPGCGAMVWGEVAQTMYTYMNKCKNNKIKKERKYLI
jgi:hypothetical protein